MTAWMNGVMPSCDLWNRTRHEGSDMKAKTIVVAVILLVVAAGAAGFGGYTVGKKAGQQSALAARNAFLQARGGQPQGRGPPAGGAPQGQVGGGFDSGNVANGEVKQVDGDTLLLSTAQEVMTVHLTGDTEIRTMATGTVADLVAGERVTVLGERGDDGSMTARSIQLGGGFGPALGAGLPAGTPAPSAGG